MKDFGTLRIWENLDVYRKTADLPKEEADGLTSNIRRASIYIPANTA
jgi:four helix bundle protein